MRGGEGRGGEERGRVRGGEGREEEGEDSEVRRVGSAHPSMVPPTNPPIACVDTIWQHPTEKKMNTIGKRTHSRYWPKTLLVSL